MSTFDPNGVGIANGNIFGFPVNEAEADIVLIPVPWDATASYGKGTSNGPKIILDASTQLDFYHPRLDKAFDTKVYMAPIPEDLKLQNDALCELSIEYIDFLENGGNLMDSPDFKKTVDHINAIQLEVKNQLKAQSKKLLAQGKIVAFLGGEHSTPLGLMEAIDELYEEFGILQIDAHADLRNAYEGFTQSHASIMFNALQNCKNLSKLVQVGIRDISDQEVELTQNDPRIKTYFDWTLKENAFNGKIWRDQVNEITSELPQNVFISFDIDGLSPELCPNTGTPVAGGFMLEEVSYLIFKVVESGRKIVGFDLNEVAPGEQGDWDANVGARALWNLVCAAELSRRNQ
ncbi:MAG: agmatinase family protein [Bacteroidota bacterium]